MTISSQTRKAGPFVGNDTSTVFPFDFKVFQAEDMLVIRSDDETGVETTLALNADYTVTLNSDQNANPGGDVVLPAVLATGYSLVATSELAYLQQTDLSNQGGFYPQVVTAALDRLTIFVQQVVERLGRSLSFPISDTGAASGVLPAANQRAGTVLAFDETGAPVAGPSVGDVGTVLGNITKVGVVADNIVDVGTVADNIAAVNAVSTDIDAVRDVSNSIVNVNAVAGSITKVNTVADSISDVQLVATKIADVSAVAGIAADVSTVADNIGDVQTVADNVVDVTNFADVYYGPSAVDPITRRDGTPLQGGDLYFNTGAVDGGLYVYSAVDVLWSLAGSVLGIEAQKVSYPGGRTLADLDSSSNVLHGDAMVAVKQPFTGAVARTQHDKNQESLSAADFGATGDGSTDDTAAMQKFLDAIAGKTGHLPLGTYLCGPLTLRSDTHLYGLGTIKAKATITGPQHLLTSPNPGSYVDKNITIEGVTFDGSGIGAGGTQTRFAELVALNRVTNLKLINVTVKNVQYIGLAIGSCKKVLVQGSTFTGCGYSGATSNAGPAVWAASASSDIPEDYQFVGCKFNDNNWHGLHLSVRRGAVHGCSFYNNKEAHIFQSRLLPNVDASDCAITGSVFDTVTKHDISSHAIETGCHRLTISGNTIRNCDHGGIALTDVRGATITGNTISNFNNLTASNSSGIDIISASALGENPERITIADNTIFDDRGTALGRSAISIAKFGAGVAVRSVTISNNNCSGTAWTSGKVVNVAAGTLGTGCTIRWNNGSSDNDPVIGNFITNAAPGTQSITGLGFKPRRIELLATSSNTTYLQQCDAVVGADGVCVYHSIQASGTSRSSYSSAGRQGGCILLFDHTGTNSCQANFTGFTDDGFQITLTATVIQAYVRYVAYP